jgi:hypothetical protein
MISSNAISYLSEAINTDFNIAPALTNKGAAAGQMGGWLNKFTGTSKQQPQIKTIKPTGAAVSDAGLNLKINPALFQKTALIAPPELLAMTASQRAKAAAAAAAAAAAGSVEWYKNWKILVPAGAGLLVIGYLIFKK